MTPDLGLLSGFARGVLLSLHVRDTCLHRVRGSYLVPFWGQGFGPLGCAETRSSFLGSQGSFKDSGIFGKPVIF